MVGGIEGQRVAPDRPPRTSERRSTTAAETAGERLRQLREAMGLSLREAAQLAGLSHGTIAQLESGKTDPDNVRARTLNALGRAYSKAPQSIRDVITGKAPYDRPAEGTSLLASHPNWVTLPLHASRSAGAAGPQAIPGEVAFVPRARLSEWHTTMGEAAAYLLDHNCLISDEARRAPKAVVWRDHVVVSKTAQPEPGSLLANWWPAAEMLTITRHGLDAENVVCHPQRAGKPTVVLPSASDLLLIGPVIFRSG